ncbi:hypothetical protein Asru_0359_02 [Acidisphaera rubrifaciens HS-AP3]|uniref:Uncharacterized protein n=1 Tax=Acidisphaera rubrifaciens HS-AP3 TaxID=1231350 RepID=A0A0D6P9I7_9PROT|nr:hypothetical protein Asru_0359_02 [Acidisphaera rubrifaciens HS-AP3]
MLRLRHRLPDALDADPPQNGGEALALIGEAAVERSAIDAEAGGDGAGRTPVLLQHLSYHLGDAGGDAVARSLQDWLQMLQGEPAQERRRRYQGAEKDRPADYDAREYLSKAHGAVEEARHLVAPCRFRMREADKLGLECTADQPAYLHGHADHAELRRLD